MRVYPADTYKAVARNVIKSSNSFRSTRRAPCFSRHPWRGIVVLARAIAAAGEHAARRYTVRQLRRPKAGGRGSCQSGGSHTRMAAEEPKQSVSSKPWSRRCRSIFSSSRNSRLARGSHKQPNKDGNICVNEAAVIVAGFQYREIRDVSCLPDCFSRPVSEYAIYLNDFMMHRMRNGDCRAIGGQAAAATLGSALFAAKKRCPKLAPNVPL